jgi:L-ascorbate metabolism protein UlaG (beta-lactamase superfamily)
LPGVCFEVVESRVYFIIAMNKLIFTFLIVTITFTKGFSQENINAEVTYIGNEGFMIVNNDKKIIIDALYNNTANNGIVNIADSINRQIINNNKPFTNNDLYLITHSHSDHYDKTMVSSYLKNNPGVLLVADSTITKPLETSFTDQIFSATPSRYESIDTTLNGIRLSVYNLKHNSAVKIYNVGYWANIDGLRIFHSGDNILEDTTEYLNTNLFDKPVDVAFLNHNGFLKSTSNSEFIVKHMKPRYIVLMHIPESQLTLVKDKVSKLDKSYPPVFVFSNSLEKISISKPTIVSKKALSNSFVYPVPATNLLWFNQPFSSHLKIQIFDLQGNILIDEPVATSPVDISSFKKGMYLAKLLYSENVTTQIFIKE